MNIPIPQSVCLPEEVWSLIMERVAVAMHDRTLVNLSHTNRVLWRLSKSERMRPVWLKLGQMVVFPSPMHLGARLRVIRSVELRRRECQSCGHGCALVFHHIGVRLCYRCARVSLTPLDGLLLPGATIRYEWLDGRRVALPRDLLRAIDKE